MLTALWGGISVRIWVLTSCILQLFLVCHRGLKHVWQALTTSVVLKRDILWTENTQDIPAATGRGTRNADSSPVQRVDLNVGIQKVRRCQIQNRVEGKTARRQLRRRRVVTSLPSGPGGPLSPTSPTTPCKGSTFTLSQYHSYFCPLLSTAASLSSVTRCLCRKNSTYGIQFFPYDNEKVGWWRWCLLMEGFGSDLWHIGSF